jgi:hypothetical protein
VGLYSAWDVVDICAVFCDLLGEISKWIGVETMVSFFRKMWATALLEEDIAIPMRASPASVRYIFS